MNSYMLRALAVSLAVFLPLLMAPARAQNTFNDNANGTIYIGSWAATTTSPSADTGTALNWSTGQVPGVNITGLYDTVGEAVIIGPLSAATSANGITIDTSFYLGTSFTNVSIGSLTFDNTNTVTIGALNSESLTVTGSIINAGDGTNFAAQTLSIPLTISAVSATLAGGGTGGSLTLGQTLGIGTTNVETTGIVNISATLTGTGPMTVGDHTAPTDTGTLTLSGANTYSGALTVDNGTLVIPNLAASGSAQPLGEGTTVVLAGSSSGAPGVLQYTGTGTNTLETLAQNVTVTTGDFGTISNTSGRLLTLGGTVSKNGSVLNLSGGAFNVTGQITGSSANSDLNVIGGSTVTLSNSNSYNGPTSISGGSALVAAVAGALPTTTPTVLTIGATGEGAGVTNTLDLDGTAQTINGLSSLGAGTNQVVNSIGSSPFTTANPTAGSLTIDPTSGVTDTFSGSLGTGANNFSVTIGGLGTEVFAGSGNYSGGTTINSGATLQLGNGGTTGSPGTGTIADNGTLVIDRSNNPTDNVVISGSGSLVQSGTGTFTIAAADTYQGATTINAGSLALGAGGSIANSSGVNLTASGATFDISGATVNPTIKGLSGTAGTVNLGANTLTVQTTVATTFGGSINGTGDLEKTGSGTLTLSGANSYSGGTDVFAGTLGLTGSGTLGSGTPFVDIASGGTLDLGGTAQTVGALSLGTGGSIIANSTGTGTLTTSGVTVGGSNNLINATATIIGAVTQMASSALTVNGTVGADSLANLATLNGVGTVGTISLAGNNTVSSTGTLTTGLITVSAASTGNTIGSGGTVAGNASQLAGSALAVNGTLGGTDNLATGATTLAGTGTVTGIVTLNGGGNVIGSNGNTLNTGGLTVVGTGGNTVVGTVVGSASQSAGSVLTVTGTLNGADNLVTGGATILNGTGTVTGAVTLNSGTALSPGTAGTAGTLHLGSLNIGTGGDLDVDLAAATTVGGGVNDLIALSGGTLTLGTNTVINVNSLGTLTTGSAYTLVNGAGSISGFNANDFTVSGLSNGETASVSENSQDTALLITINPAVVNGYYYTGAVAAGNFNTAGNYQTLPGAGAVPQTVDLDTTSTGIAVIIGATTTAPATGQTISLSAAASISSLTFSATGAGDSIAGGSGPFILTIGASGINVQTGTNDTETISAPVALGANQTWTVSDSGGTLDDTGGISGAFSLTVEGGGTVQFGAANTYTGATIVNAGALLITNSGALADTSSVTVGSSMITSGAALQLSGGLTFSAPATTLYGTGLTDGALENVSGDNTYSGAITLGSAATIGSDTGTLTVSTITGTNTNLTLASGTSSGNGVVTGAITTGSGTLTKTGTGTWTLDGVNTFTGATTISGGTLALGAGSHLILADSSGINLVAGATLDITAGNQTIQDLNGAGGTVSLGASALTLGTGNASSFGGLITGTGGSLIKMGAGTLTLSNANNYSGGTTINGGVVSVSGDANTGLGNYTLGGGELLTTASFATAKTVTLDAGTDTLAATTTTTSTYNGIISGTGALTLGDATNTGTVVLTALNTFSGGTTIAAGTAVVGVSDTDATDGAFGGSSRSVLLGAASGSANSNLLIDGAFTLSNAITVQGGSTGMATIGGSNTAGTATYSGNITLDKAVTLVAATGGTVDFSGATWTANNNAITIGSAGNTGTVEIDHALGTTAGVALAFGTLDLDGALTGNATVASGTTLEGSGSVSGTTGVTSATVTGTNLTLTGVTTFNGANNLLSGTVTSTAGVAVATNSALTQTGTLTGSLSNVLGMATVGGTVTGNAVVGAGGTLAGTGIIDGTTGVTSGTVNGTSLTLTGATTFNGSGNILSGTETALAPVTIAGTGAVTQSGTLTGSVSDTSSGTSAFNGIIAGLGSTVSQSGPGTLILNNGSNSFGGGTTISAGTLLVGNSSALGSGIITQTGGNLMTTGTGGFQINAPAGYTQNGGTLTIQLNSDTNLAMNDLLNVTGGATLNGSLALQFNFVPVKGDMFTVVQTTTGITGGTGAGYVTPITSPAGYQVTGSVIGGGDDFSVDVVSVQFALNGQLGNLYSPNRSAILGYIDHNVSPGSNLGVAITAALAGGNLPATSADIADQESPVKFANFIRSNIINTAAFSTQSLDVYFASGRSAQGAFFGGNGQIDSSALTVADPTMDPGLASIGSRLLAWSPAPLPHGLLSDSSIPALDGTDMKDMKDMRVTTAAQPGHDFNAFIAGNVVLGQDFSQADTPHADTTTGTVQIGADYRITPHLRTGVMFGYGHTDADLDNMGSKATVDSYAPGAYAAFADGGWYANVLGSYGFNSYTEDRNLSIGGFTSTAHGAPDGSQIVGNLDGGYDFHMNRWTFGPTLGVQYVHLEVNSFTEDGAGALGSDESVNDQQTDSLRSRLGAHVSYLFHAGTVRLTPHLDASWQHEFLDQSRGITAQFNGLGTGSFIVDTPNPSRDSALIDCGLDADLNGQLSLFGDYLVQAGQSNYFGQSVQAGVKLGF